MNKILIKNNNSNELIIFFNGFGMDENPFSHLKTNKNIITFYRYNLENNFELDLNKFKKVYLIAWSFGIFFGNEFLKNNNVFFSLAINGSLNPISDNEGISFDRFNNFFEEFKYSNEKFYKSVSGSNKILEVFLKNKPLISHDQQIEELIFLKKMFENKKQNKNYFNKIMISNKDLIFKYNNVIKGWNLYNIKPIINNFTHFPFFQYNSWEEILNSAIDE